MAGTYDAAILDLDRAFEQMMGDLERRGLLDDTLVVWSGEFGRTSMNEKRGGSTFLGRDHHPDAFTVWLAGGGMKRGHVHGATDEFGSTIVADPVSVRDLQCTIFDALGLDAHRVRFPFQGLEQRWIGPEADPRVIDGVIA